MSSTVESHVRKTTVDGLGGRVRLGVGILMVYVYLCINCLSSSTPSSHNNLACAQI